MISLVPVHCNLATFRFIFWTDSKYLVPIWFTSVFASSVLLKFTKLQYFFLALFGKVFGVTDKVTISETAV